MEAGKPKIGGFHSIDIHNLQKGCRSKEDGYVSVFGGAKYGGQEWGQKVIQEPSEDITESIPKGL
jgi:hypothetical protein